MRLWDLDADRELRRFDARPARIECMAPSPDGRRILTGGNDGVVRVWEVESGREVGRLAKHDDTVLCVGFTPDGRRALSGGGDKDKTVRIWDLSRGQEVHCLRGFNSGLRSLAITPDSRGVVVASGDGAPQLWGLPDRDSTPEILGAGVPLVHTLDGKISDIAVGGGGRFLFLLLKDKRKLAVFDANEANVVKTISLPSDSFLVAAGASSFFIVFPDEKIAQRWDIATMTRQGGTFSLPIKGRLKGLAMGSDSDGSLLAIWSPDSNGSVNQQSRFSFIDPKTFKVLKAGPITTGGLQGIGGVSPSGGSFTMHPFLQDRVHIRASAGGDLFGIWQTNASPSGFQTLSVRKGALRAIYNHDGLDHLSPGPDGHTVYTGRGGALDSDGKPVRGGDSRPGTTPELTVPTLDAAYYLSINWLSGNTAPNAGGGTVSARVTASVHAAGDGIRVLTVRDLDEMNGARNNESFIQDDFTVEKRFHFVPAANLLVTIPFTNDRLVLRRLDVRKALDQLGGDYLVVTTASNLYATAGKTFNHQIEALSKAGGIRYTVAQGPDGLTVSPTGKVTWLEAKSPASGDVVTAVVTVADSTGTERFHTLRIHVN